MTAPLDEDGLIARYFAPIAGPGGLGLLDDAACLPPVPGQDLVVTADALVAGIHFFPDDPPASIARKALGVNLSDLAAKAARPSGFILTLAIEPGWREDWLDQFARGLAALSLAAGCPLIGGDTVRTPGPLTLSITAFGTVPCGRMVARTGARAGDRIYVSGTIGDAALGLQLRLGRVSVADGLSEGARALLLDRYLHPRPRLGLRPALLDHAHGSMDVSDGFVGDLGKMMRASGVSAEVDLARVPLSLAAAELVALDPARLASAVTGGDDYEVLTTVPAAASAAFEAEAARLGEKVTAVGEVVAGSAPPLFRDADGRPVRFERGSFSHF